MFQDSVASAREGLLACLDQVQETLHLDQLGLSAQTTTYDLGILSGLTVLFATYAVWLIYLHPLAAFPGPKKAVISNVSTPLCYSAFKTLAN